LTTRFSFWESSCYAAASVSRAPQVCRSILSHAVGLLGLPSLFILLCLFVLISPSRLSAGGNADYAQWLMNEKDYFRAISEYKRVLFDADDPEIRIHCKLQIAKAYYRSNKYRSSIQYMSRVLNDPRARDSVKSKAKLYLGLDYYGMKTPVLARQYFLGAAEYDTTGLPDIYLSLLRAESGDWSEAGSSYLEIAERRKGTEIAVIARELAELSYCGDSISYRNPGLAAIFSALIPGSGQFYCNHYYDGIQALIYVGAFTLASYAAYRYDRDINDNYVSTYATLSIASIFYIGNIVGAMKTAEYRNLKLKQKHLRIMRQKAFLLEP